MKNVWNASSGFLPKAENRMNPATIVSPAASTGERYAIRRDGSARASSLSRTKCLLMGRRKMRLVSGIRPHSAHPDADFLDVGFLDGLGRRKPAFGDDRDPVAKLARFVRSLR